jgi:recombination protein RecT
MPQRNSATRPGFESRVQGSSVVVADNAGVIKQINDSERAVERALPSHLKGNAAAYTRALVTIVKQTPDLLKCDPMTILGGLMTASQLGLEFGPLGHCYLIPFKGQAQFILGYKGKIDLAWRSGKLTSIAAREVRENDRFDFDYGVADSLEHKPELRGDRGVPYAWYCMAKFVGGGHYFVVLDRQSVDRHRAESRSQSSEYSPWNKHFSQMAMKSAIHEATPFLPLTTEVLREMAMDGLIARGVNAEELEVERTDFIDVDSGPLAEVPSETGASLFDSEGEFCLATAGCMLGVRHDGDCDMPQ